MALDEKTISIIRADFPEDSVQVKKGFKDAATGKQMYLTGYKPQYIFERLNDAFGHDGWSYEIIEKGIEGKDAWVWGRLSIYKIIIDEALGTYSRILMSSVDQFGTGSYNAGTSLGDAMKGASSNALEKCASLKDIGHLAYKGLVGVPEEHPESQNLKADKAKSDRDNTIKELGAICKKYKIDTKSFPTLTKNVLKESIESNNIASIETADLVKLIEFVKKHEGPF